MNYLLYGGIALFIIASIVMGSPRRNHRWVSLMFFGVGIFLMGIHSLSGKFGDANDMRVVSFINLFLGGTLFGMGLARLLPPPEDIRAFFRRKVLGS
jgi:hypothetical protein